MRTIVEFDFIAKDKQDALRKIDRHMTNIYGYLPEYECPEIVLTPKFVHKVGGDQLIGVEVHAWVWTNG